MGNGTDPCKPKGLAEPCSHPLNYPTAPSTSTTSPQSSSAAPPPSDARPTAAGRYDEGGVLIDLNAVKTLVNTT